MTAATNKDLLVSMIQTESNYLVEAAFECLRRRMLDSNWPDRRGPTNGVQVKWLRKRGPATAGSRFRETTAVRRHSRPVHLAGKCNISNWRVS